MVGRGAHNGQAKGQIDAGVKGQHFHGGQPLIVVHGDNRVVLAGQMLVKNGIGGDGTGDIPPAAAATGQRGGNHALFFVAERAAVTGMGIESANADASAREAHPRQRAGEHLNGLNDDLLREGGGHVAQGQMPGGENHADFLAKKHHGIAPGSGKARKQFRVADFANAGALEGGFVDGRGNDGIQLAVLRGGGSAQYVGIGGAGGGGADLAGVKGRRGRHAGVPRGATGQRGGQSGNFRRARAAELPGHALPDRTMANQHDSTPRRLAGADGTQGHFRADTVGVAGGDANGDGFHGRALIQQVMRKNLDVILGAERVEPDAAQAFRFSAAQVALDGRRNFGERAGARGAAAHQLNDI